MGLQPAVPGLHQLFGLSTGIRLQMQHPSWAAPAGAALGVGADGALLFKEIKRLLQHGFREPQLGFLPHQLLQQSGGIVVVLQQTLEHPADRQLEVQELRWWLLEVLLDVGQAGTGGLATGKHSGRDAVFI